MGRCFQACFNTDNLKTGNRKMKFYQGMEKAPLTICVSFL